MDITSTKRHLHSFSHLLLLLGDEPLHMLLALLPRFFEFFPLALLVLTNSLLQRFLLDICLSDQLLVSASLLRS